MTQRLPTSAGSGGGGGGIHAFAPGNPVYDRWAAQVEYFQSIRGKLMAEPGMPGKFVAIRDNSVVDSDADEYALANRMYQRFPGEGVLVARVQAEDPVVELPGLELR